ncbi:MAG: mitochondrial fission ELM1 family protein [Planctomycetes bacterium]|nr:mitochondrial fission ELM1 family protein [Planctomycetota bacterium]
MKTNTPSILSKQEHSKVGSFNSKELSNLTIVPHKETSSSWVSEHLANAARVWVSADSVSMVYESLTNGVRPLAN